MASQPATILVVDDTPESLRFVTATLEKAGMTVLIAGDGAAALQSLELAGERSLPDLVIMDAMMPVMDGFETTRRIKADTRFSRLPVIFMTGLTETEHVVRGLEAGGVDYVTKPIVVEELLARIRVHLGNARVSSGSQAALDDSGRPLLAVDGAGRLLWATPRSTAMLARLFPPAGSLAPALAAALARHVASDGQGVVRHDLDDGRLELTLLTRNGSDEWLFRLAEIREGAEERLLAARHGLTEREAEVLLWISRGKANREISEILGISPRTVNKHLEQVFEKMGIENRASAAAAAVKTLTQ
ncbi:MAG: DNA-binding response regulator [Alphaproteobacteria bacterium]|nr:MAG: DNA-binding response regulator [Alphaproteobacteria bacterium]